MSDREAFENWIKNKNIFSGNDDNEDVIWAKSFMFKAWQAQQAKIDELQARIDEVLKTCDNLRTDLIRENHVEYDKGWKDCATSIYYQLKGSKDEN